MIENVHNLHEGDELLFKGPEGDKYLTISTIEIIGDIACIMDTDGDYIECFVDELY